MKFIKDRFEMVIGSEDEDEKSPKKEKFNKKDQITFKSKFGLADSYQKTSKKTSKNRTKG